MSATRSCGPALTGGGGGGGSDRRRCSTGCGGAAAAGRRAPRRARSAPTGDDRAHAVVLAGPAPRRPRAGGAAWRRAGIDEAQPQAAAAHGVAVLEHVALDALLLEVHPVRRLEVLEDVAAAAPEHARVVARDHGVVGPDRAVHGAADPDLGRCEIDRSLDALCIAPEEPWPRVEKGKHTAERIHKFTTGDRTGMVSERPCAASSASTATTRQRTSRTSACTPSSTGARSRPAWSRSRTAGSAATSRWAWCRTRSTRRPWPGCRGETAIGHVRYSTAGSSELRNAQPFVFEYAGGQLAIAHNGNIVNANELRAELDARARSSRPRATPRSSST